MNILLWISFGFAVSAAAAVLGGVIAGRAARHYPLADRPDEDKPAEVARDDQLTEALRRGETPPNGRVPKNLAAYRDHCRRDTR